MAVGLCPNPLTALPISLADFNVWGPVKGKGAEEEDEERDRGRDGGSGGKEGHRKRERSR